MQQMELFDSIIPCPCIGICKMDTKGFCKGCARNGDERFLWFQLDNEKKRDVHRLCKLRKKRWALDAAFAHEIQPLSLSELQFSLFASEFFE